MEFLEEWEGDYRRKNGDYGREHERNEKVAMFGYAIRQEGGAEGLMHSDEYASEAYERLQMVIPLGDFAKSFTSVYTDVPDHLDKLDDNGYFFQKYIT